MHINCLELSNWTRLTETPSTIGMRSVCSLQWLFMCILTVSSDPASIPWLNKPIIVPSHSSDKFDESALHCWRNFIILFPGVITLNKRIMDWEQNYCKTVFLIKGFIDDHTTEILSEIFSLQRSLKLPLSTVLSESFLLKNYKWIKKLKRKSM